MTVIVEGCRPMKSDNIRQLVSSLSPEEKIQLIENEM